MPDTKFGEHPDFGTQDSCFIQDQNRAIRGAWLRNPSDANDQIFMIALFLKGGLSAEEIAGRFRIVPNKYTDEGGCFVMLGSFPAPGEAGTANVASGKRAPAQNKPTPHKCERCGANEPGFTCSHCGYTDWGSLAVMFAVGAVIVSVGLFVCGPGVLRWVCLIPGGVMLLFAIAAGIRGLVWKPKSATQSETAQPLGHSGKSHESALLACDPEPADSRCASCEKTLPGSELLYAWKCSRCHHILCRSCHAGSTSIAGFTAMSSPRCPFCEAAKAASSERRNPCTWCGATATHTLSRKDLSSAFPICNDSSCERELGEFIRGAASKIKEEPERFLMAMEDLSYLNQDPMERDRIQRICDCVRKATHA